jgi:O-antigen ligase
VIVYYILLLLMPFWEYPRLPRIGETFTVIKMIGLLAVVLAVVKWIFGERKTYLFRFTEVRLFAALLIVAAASAFFRTPGGLLSAPMQTYFSLAAFFFVTLVFVDSFQRLETACCVIVLSMVLASYSIFSGFVKYGSRPGGIVGDSNYFALIAVATLPLAYFLIPAASPIRKLFLAGSGMVIVAAVLLSGSRGGLISLGACVLYSLSRIRRKVLFFLAAGTALAVLLAVLPETGLSRFLVEDTGTRVSTQARVESNKAGWEMITSSPLTGVGLGRFKPVFAQIRPDLEGVTIAHNTYVEVAAELGLPAVVLFLLILMSSWRRARRSSQFLALAGEHAGAQVAVSIEVGIVAYSVGALFLSAEYSKQLWVLIGIGIALARLAMEREIPQDVVDPAGGSSDDSALKSSIAASGG